MRHVLRNNGQILNHRRKKEGQANKRKEKIKILDDLIKGDGYSSLKRAVEEMT